MKFTDDINRNFVVKWSKALTDSNNAVTSGVFHAPAEEFITKIEDEAEFIKMVRYVEMDGEKADLEQLRVHPRLQNMQKLSSSKVLTQDILTDLAETTPEFLKTTLTAVPLTAFTNIPKGFLKTNLEGDAFTSTYENILAPAVASLIMLVAKVWDAVNDPMMGAICERSVLYTTPQTLQPCRRQSSG